MKQLLTTKNILTCLLASTSLTGFSQNSEAAKPVNPPNILVFVADDAGMETGCYGYPGIKTPTIDRMAENGLKFEKAFLTAPQCSPTRTSLLSGKFAHTIGTEDLHTGLPEGIKILPAYLEEQGYFTGFMLKGHFGQNAADQFNWTDNGFWPDWVKGHWNENALGYFTEFVNKAGENPFFMWMAFVDPHRPYYDGVNDAPRVNDPAGVTVPPYLADTEKTRQDLADYYNYITRMDEHMGNMINVLREKGMLENTLIIYFSDNGAPFPRAKGTVYDAGIQTPFVACWPGHIEPGTSYPELVSMIDLAPTIIDVAGGEVPEDMYGNSLKEVFYDQNVQGREYIFAERNWHGADEHIRCIRTNRYTLIRNSIKTELPHGSPSDVSSSPSWQELKRLLQESKLTPGQQRLFEAPRPAIELYDLENDPDEFMNVANHPDYMQIGRELIGLLEQWRKETKDRPYYKRRKPDNVCRVTGFRITGERPVEYYIE
jgi:N-sulfoglucosamine sulfohydrolase